MMDSHAIRPAPRTGSDDEPKVQARKHTLGNVRLRDRQTNEIILIPAPSSDPNDPLNWSRAQKYWMATLICFAMMICNWLAAGPSIAVVETSLALFPGSGVDDETLYAAITKVAWFFTTTALMQGVGNFFWVPMANRYGRRPVYVVSYAIYFACAIWLVFEKSYGGFLAGRILMGFGSGAAETIAPLSIADVFFLHERGTVMALYNSFLSVGVAFGMVFAGLISISHEWRAIYEVGCALVGFVLLLAFFTFPETAFIRSEPGLEQQTTNDTVDKAEAGTEVEGSAGRWPAKRSYLQSLRVFRGPFTDERLVTLVLRPLGLICLPPVLWAALVQSVTIGFLVAVTSNVAIAFDEAYGFSSWQIGLCFVAAVAGSLVGIPAGGVLGDWVADRLTRRNGGVREPEMRLPAMVPSLVTTPLALVLYGVGIEYRLHWVCPTIAFGLLNFSIVQGTNICLVYVIDGYRPIAGEVTLTVMGFKSLFGFLLSFYTNPWVNQAGYRDAYGAMAGIAAFVILGWVPLFYWGKSIRHVTWHWPVVSLVHWSDDREVGE